MLGWSECSATRPAHRQVSWRMFVLFHLYAHRKSCLHPGDCLWISEASPFLDVTAHHPEQQQQLPDLTQFLSTCSVYMTLKQGSSRSRTMGLSALHRQVSDALAVHGELARCVGCSGREKVSGTNTQMLPALSFPDLCPRSGWSSRLPRSWGARFLVPSQPPFLLLGENTGRVCKSLSSSAQALITTPVSVAQGRETYRR